MRNLRVSRQLPVLSLLLASVLIAGARRSNAADTTPGPFAPGNIVVTKSIYAGTPSTVTVGQTLPGSTKPAIADGTYPFIFNNDTADSSFGITSPIFIDQYMPNGSLVNSLAVPTNLLVTSFPSKSELAINITTNGNIMTFMGYQSGINQLDVSNSNTPGIIEPGNPVTTPATFRVVAQVDLAGSIQTTTTNAYNGNNPRGVVLANGLYYAAGNAGNGNGSPATTLAAGSQIIIPGQNATAATPGTIQDGSFNITQYGYPADKSAKDNNFRGITVFNNTLYMSKGSGGNGINTVYQIGNAGSLPTVANPAPQITVLPGFPTGLAKTISATNTSTEFYPFGIWFANATTLYVGDEGSGGNTAPDTPAANPNAGLQKWILVNGTWQLAYTLQAGLNLGVPYTVPNGPNGEVYPTGNNPVTNAAWAPAPDGLRNINGKVNSDGTVTIYGITSTVSGSGDQGADPNQLVAITDNLAATTLPAAEKFTVLKTAAYGEVLRGVAVIPNYALLTTSAGAFTGVAAGDVTTSDVILWTRRFDANNPVSTPLICQVATDAAFKNIVVTSNGNTSVAEDYTLKLNVTGLQSGTRYYYRFLAPGGYASNTGTFKTAYAANVPAAVHFAFSGDCDGQWRPFPSVANFPSLNLDFFMFLGDTTYENAVSPDSPAVTAPDVNLPQAITDLRRKYRENISPENFGGASSLRDFFASQANYTCLDNHELCSNVGGVTIGGVKFRGPFQAGGAPLWSPSNPFDPTNTANDANTGAAVNKAPGFIGCVQAYRDYEPIREKIVSAPSDPRTDGTLQLYNSQQWGKNVLFINTDCRSYRDMRMQKTTGADDTGSRADNPKRSMLGATQLAWVEQQLLAAQTAGTPWKVVSISDPIDQVGPIGGALPGTFSFTSSDGGKSWMGGYRAERNLLLKFIADNKITNVIFIATDDHQNRVNELLYFPDPVNAPTVQAYVPTCFSVVAGPIGASGPENITDHSFGNIKTLADSLASAQKTAGVNPVGLDPAFPGLHNVMREGDPNADTLRQPVDFFSPDTENYATLDFSADGKTFTYATWGINSYPANTFPEASTTGNVRQILGFQIDAQPTLVTVTAPAVSGPQNSAIPLTITPTLANSTFPQTISVQVSGVPATATLSAGTNNGGVWTLTQAQLTGLTITSTGVGVIPLTVTANVLDSSNLVTGSASTPLKVTVTPGFTSGPSFSPNPAIVNLATTFTAVVNPTTATITWNFGDGGTATGASVSHIFTAEGTYTVTVVANDPATGSTTVTLPVTVGHATSLPGSKSFTKYAGSIHFKGTSGDQITLISSFAATGTQTSVVVTMGGLTETFTVNSKGQGKSADGKAIVKSHNGTVSLSFKLSGALKSKFTSGEAVDANGNPSKFLLAVSWGTVQYSAVVPLTLKVSPSGSSATFKSGK